MEQIVVEKEPEGLIEGEISINYDKPSSSAEQEIKEKLDGKESETFTNEEDNFDEADISVMKFEAEDEMFLDPGTDSELYEAGKESRKDKSFQCDFCPKKYKRRCGLNAHIKNIHNREPQKQLKFKKQTVKQDHFKKHLKLNKRKNHLKNHFKCNFCHYTAAALKTLNSHMLNKHEPQNKINLTGKMHVCPKCSYSTGHKSNYDDHTKLCLKLENVQWYKCHICHFKTLYKSSFNSHKYAHNKKKGLGKTSYIYVPLSQN
ncbi:unnamed protein product [Brassicogethes aeneus]|uniref:C2H2-type domain-containing protein n=1 Tax=Brassicogethes aeneus TaxID=1431903 RepID=A0A9P0FE70_BRAAE|nr:unnamed protein product [Brassicogethes aeneus]